MVRTSLAASALNALESQSYEDIVRDLNASFARLPRARLPAGVAPPKQARLVLPEDSQLPGWRPPPSKEAIRKAVDLKPPFIKYQRIAGEEFMPAKYVRGKILDPRTAARALQPYRCYEKFVGDKRGLEIQRFRRQPEAWGEPSNSLCEPRHRKWLEQHAETREKHVYSIYYAALQNERKEAHERQQLIKERRANSLIYSSQSSPAISAVATIEGKCEVLGSI